MENHTAPAWTKWPTMAACVCTSKAWTVRPPSPVYCPVMKVQRGKALCPLSFLFRLPYSVPERLCRVDTELPGSEQSVTGPWRLTETPKFLKKVEEPTLTGAHTTPGAGPGTEDTIYSALESLAGEVLGSHQERLPFFFFNRCLSSSPSSSSSPLPLFLLLNLFLSVSLPFFLNDIFTLSLSLAKQERQAKVVRLAMCSLVGRPAARNHKALRLHLALWGYR